MEREGHWSLIAAIQWASDGRIEGEWARRVLRALTGEHNLPAWEQHPLRKRKHVLELLNEAIAELKQSRRVVSGWSLGKMVLR